MGETTCLMHAFSYASPTPFEAKEGNPIHAVGESVSFGRFMSESLSWEKWSTFSHKRYVEEAAQYSKPGSVAQKKAFFEAYYKRKAMLEKANAGANSVQESPVECIDDNVNSLLEPKAESVDQYIAAENMQRVVSELRVIVEQQEVKAPSVKTHLVPDSRERDLDLRKDELATGQAEGDERLSESSVVVETLSHIGNVDDYYNEAASLNVENHIEDAEPELSEETEMEKPLLKDIRTNQEELESANNKKPEISSLKPLLVQSKQSPKVQSSPSKRKAATNHPRKETATPIKMNTGKDSLDRMKAGKNSPARCKATIDHPRKENTTPIKTNTGKDSLDRMKAGKNSPARCKAAIDHPRKENATPIKINTGKDSFDRIKESPMPLHMYMNVTPSRDPNKPMSRAIWNLGPSRVPVSSLKPPKNCKSPMKTPAAGCSTKKSAATPKSENRRTTTLLPSASGSRSIGAKWRSLAMENKLRSPSISSPFSLRTEERAARRKEKLEEKFNEKVVHKVQLQTTLKDKAESELKKLRQSLCFKARPLPDFYKERKTTNRKDPAIPQSPKLKRDSNISTDQTRPSLPPKRPFPKSNSSKHPLQKKIQSQIRPQSLADMISHENTSPNIVS